MSNVMTTLCEMFAFYDSNKRTKYIYGYYRFICHIILEFIFLSFIYFCPSSDDTKCIYTRICIIYVCKNYRLTDFISQSDSLASCQLYIRLNLHNKTIKCIQDCIIINHINLTFSINACCEQWLNKYQEIAHLSQ